MKKALALLISMIMTLSLLSALFTVPALASNDMPEEIELEVSTEEDGSYLTKRRVMFLNPNNMSVSGFSNQVTLTNGNSGELEVGIAYSCLANFLYLTFSINTSDWENADPGDYSVSIDWTAFLCISNDSNEGDDITWEESGTITVTVTKEAPESSEEETSEETSEEVSEEESSEPEESSEESSEEGSSESSKASKPANPGKPDELSMGGSTGGTTGGGKESPSTGAKFAPLAALGVASLAGLAIIAFKKH